MIALVLTIVAVVLFFVFRDDLLRAWYKGMEESGLRRIKAGTTA